MLTVHFLNRILLYIQYKSLKVEHDKTFGLLKVWKKLVIKKICHFFKTKMKTIFFFFGLFTFQSSPDEFGTKK